MAAICRMSEHVELDLWLGPRWPSGETNIRRRSRPFDDAVKNQQIAGWPIKWSDRAIVGERANFLLLVVLDASQPRGADGRRR